MSVKKKLMILIMLVALILINIGILTHRAPKSDDVILHLSIEADAAADITVFYSSTGIFDMINSKMEQYTGSNSIQELEYTIDSLNSAIRLDLGDTGKIFKIQNAYYEYKGERTSLNLEQFGTDNALEINNLQIKKVDSDILEMEVVGEDPYVSAEIGPHFIQNQVQKHLAIVSLAKNISYAVVFDLACLILFLFRKKFSSLPIELVQNRQIIMKLSKNDFKTKYAGSYLGITWAFVQPIITVLVYWFVFQVGLRSGDVGNFPFVLWLVAGLVPWFFFQDTLNAGTNALIEYSYLVKKVVFKISILPIVKEMSALFVHVFFVAFTLLIYSAYGYFPDLYTLQVIYYTFAMFVLTLGICYATSAIVVFFRDLTQIINIVLQVGIWMTPIMWNIEVLGAQFPRWLITAFKANPLYYIVNGYRDALINKVWFWERFDLTFYYWVFTAIVFVVGTVIFKRLKVHFADIL